MAVVSGHSFFPSAELDTNNSDDEYDYVSSLAEQIAHAMLDDDEPSDDHHSPDLLFHSQQALLSERRAAFLRLQREAEMAKEALSTRLSLSRVVSLPVQPFSHEEIALVKARQQLHAAAGAEAWDCYSGEPLLRSHPTSSLHDHTLNALYNKTPQMHWTASSALDERESWMRSNAEASRVASGNQRTTTRKESVGTGVFLPRVSSFGTQARRKSDNSAKLGEKNKYRSGR